jgi:plasmid stabilization system protein ParE
VIHEVRLRAEAEQDLADAAAWYEKQQSGLARQFLDEVLATLSNVALNPAGYPTLWRDARRAIVRRFPFSVYCRIDEATIVVVGILHGSRHPQRWKARLEGGF